MLWGIRIEWMMAWVGRCVCFSFFFLLSSFFRVLGSRVLCVRVSAACRRFRRSGIRSNSRRAAVSASLSVCKLVGLGSHKHLDFSIPYIWQIHRSSSKTHLDACLNGRETSGKLFEKHPKDFIGSDQLLYIPYIYSYSICCGLCMAFTRTNAFTTFTLQASIFGACVRCVSAISLLPQPLSSSPSSSFFSSLVSPRICFVRPPSIAVLTVLYRCACMLATCQPSFRCCWCVAACVFGNGTTRCVYLKILV